MKLKYFSIVLSLLASQLAWGEFNPHVDTLRLGNKQSTGSKQLIFDINQGANDPQISCSDTTGVITITSAGIPMAMPSASPSPGQVLTAQSGSATAWQASTGVQAGTLIPYTGFNCPSGYIAADGSNISRTSFPALFAQYSVSTSAVMNSTITLTGLSSTTGMIAGMHVTGTGVPTGATIASIVSGTSITLSAAATVTATNTIIIYMYGVGDGTTTFGIANASGVFLRGSGSQTITGTYGIHTYSSINGQAFGDLTAKNGIQDTGHTHYRNTSNTVEVALFTTGGAAQFAAGGSSGYANYSTTQTGFAVIVGDTETRPAGLTVLYCVKY